MANEIGTAYLVVLPQLDSDFESTLGSLVGGMGEIPFAVSPEVQGDVEETIGAQVDDAGPGVTAKAVALGSLMADAISEGLKTGLDILGELPDIGLKFQQTRAQIRGATGETGDALQTLHDIANDIFKTSPAALDDITTAVDLVHQRLQLPPDDLETISRRIVQLARISGTDVKQMADDTTGMFNLWDIGADKQEGSLDKLLRVSQQTGVGVGDITSQLSGAGLQLQSLGFTFDDSISLIGNLGKSGLDLSVTTAAFRKSLSEAAKEGKPANEVFRETFDAIKNAPDDTAAAGIAVENFGARGTQMAAAIRNGQFAWEDLTDQIQSGDTVETAAKDVGTFASKFEILKHNAELAFEPIGAGLADTLSGVATFAGDVWNTFQTEGWDAAWDKITGKVDQIWEGDPTTGQEGVHAKLNRFIAGLPGWAVEAGGKLLEIGGQLLEGLVGWADSVWEGDPATGKEGVKAKLERWIASLPDWFIEKGGQVAGWAQGLLDATISWADGLWEGDEATGKEGLHTKLNNGMDQLGRWLEVQPSHIATKAKEMLDAAVGWAQHLWEGNPDTGQQGVHQGFDKMISDLDTWLDGQGGEKLAALGEKMILGILIGSAIAVNTMLTLYETWFEGVLKALTLVIIPGFFKLGWHMSMAILRGLAAAYLSLPGPIKAFLQASPGSGEFFGALEEVGKLTAAEPPEDHDLGGMVGGPLGAPKMILAHGGERVLTPAQNANYEAGGLRSASAGAGQVVNIGTIVSDRPEPTAREVILQLREERWLASA